VFAALGLRLLLRDARCGPRWVLILAHFSAGAPFSPWDLHCGLWFGVGVVRHGAAILAPTVYWPSVGDRSATCRRDPETGFRRRAVLAALFADAGRRRWITALAFDHLPSAVLAPTLAALVLAWCAYLYRRPLFVLLGSGLFVVPFRYRFVTG